MMRKAVALRYDRHKNQAPQLVASGQGLIAAKILELAEANQIPLYQHAELAETLISLPVGSEIPPDLYELVAEILAFVLRLDQKKSGNYRSDRNG